MAKLAGLLNLLLVVSVVVGLAGYAAAQAEGLGPAASGGRIEENDVKNNIEVQQLGRYCVIEYNKSLQVRKHPENGPKRLSFSEVIKAEKQVVAGLKYYLTIKAAGSDGQIKTFDAELVINPPESFKKMLAFAPTTQN
ncbi:cysteine proteinase inhibitor B-like [Ipomoea triloba]|uniref:cysteine proteinase inhibitor B-like n=1 Tax=Ipomoea triloba TaxID=35885 RepID=UPI00125DD954|nr:cysteine proteinase inhibitor B-like [Ipomoea triloba]